MSWQTSRYRIDLSRPRVMGIVNVTPDSFSDGGLYARPADALAHCERLVAEGADILDIGGESTRPGARAPDTAEELARVRPVLAHALTLGLPVSVDTSDPAVMRAAIDLGVDIVNDVRALQRPGAVEVLAAHPAAGVCLMHMRGEPGEMQQDPVYTDVVVEVRDFLRARWQALAAAGIADERIVLDPGIGFGKTVAHNLTLVRGLSLLHGLGAAVLFGASRKRFIGTIGGADRPEARLPGSIAVALEALRQGVQVIRVHDVAETRQAMALWTALNGDGRD